MEDRWQPVGAVDPNGQFDRRINPMNPNGDFARVPRYRPDPKDDPRKGLCIGKDNTCKARQAKGTAYCVGHLKQIAKQKKEANENDAAE